jgi:hypothetical protein
MLRYGGLVLGRSTSAVQGQHDVECSHAHGGGASTEQHALTYASTGSRAKGRGKPKPNITRNGIGNYLQSGCQPCGDGEARGTDQVREGRSAT